MAPTKKRTPNGISIPSEPSSTSNGTSQSGSLMTDPLPVVKVNTANLNEIKAALDDIVKKVSLLA